MRTWLYLALLPGMIVLLAGCGTPAQVTPTRGTSGSMEGATGVPAVPLGLPPTIPPFSTSPAPTPPEVTPRVRMTAIATGVWVGSVDMPAPRENTRPPEAYFTPTPGGTMWLPPNNLPVPPTWTPNPRIPLATVDPRILPVDTTFTPPYPTPWWVTPGVGTGTPTP